MKKAITAAIAASVLMIGCTNQSTEVKRLQAENDSLLQVNAQTTADFNEMIQLINDVEEGFRQMKEAENYLVTQKDANGEVSLTTREQIKNDMTLVAETLQKNKERLDKLQQQLKQSKNQSASLQKTIERLQAEITEKTELITSLQESLAKRDVRIAELDDAVNNLIGQVENLATENQQQKEVLQSQDEALNTVYYALGTNKELKEQKIVEGGGLFSSKKVMESDFNKDYFTTADMRKLHEIPFDSKKAKFLTKHPEGSYELQKDNEGYLTLVITNPENFWSLSRYLVVELK
ncbi:hypothetical protein [Barnesiella sp. An55]|uniref:Cbp1 family collagen-binding glycoprotein adhesin n=1 Tax=Barnesiella sp. An55 TaxID=1965646 RepID=UPI000B36CEEB|nr:hypothetical protein [Barnesiella sp. An55]OUN72639.1 hypothetical protein B5G10_07070 [Barnesiella sp. An55]